MTIAALAPRVARQDERLSSIEAAQRQAQTQLTSIELLLRESAGLRQGAAPST